MDNSRKQIILDLKNISQLKALKYESIRIISKVCIEKNYSKGEILFSEGDKADTVHFLITGYVEIWKDYHFKNKDLIAKQDSGNTVGEMAVIDELTRSATVVAGEKVKTYTINRNNFMLLLQKLPQFSFEFMKSISMLVRKSNDSFVAELRDKNAKLEKKNKRILEMQDELVKKERLSIVGQFSSMILHDIRNPISIIKGYSEILQMKYNEPENVKIFAESIQREAFSLNSLASEMLDYSRGDIRLNLSIVELDMLVKNVFSRLEKRIPQDKIQLISNVVFAGPVLMDFERMNRVLVNLCDNSRKALLDGGIIRIKISIDNEHYEIKVIDNGDGISPEKLARIFDPFASFSRAGGSGLGMVIVKNIIEAHKGTVEVLSVEDEGTNVIIRMPLHM